ncbi:MAG TPA: hypothetical protein VHJ39_15915 [Solirubrobacteraceae bacterium]|jgi:hypothetical protein|nr:hypothetical protein [Solirubrobacteraceae bacterium]
MPEPAIGLRLEVALEPDADAAELEHATSQLREELRELDLERVDRPTEPAPPGSRGLDVAALGTLIVGAGRGAIGPVLTNASREDQRRLVESFVARHSP